MMKNKPRILMCSEASFLQTGYSNYTRELLIRLYNTGKYEIAEFASYGLMNDPRDKKIPWMYYPNAVPKEHEQYKNYAASIENSFGKWRFDNVVIDFKPDIVFDIRDYWMNSYQAKSVLRPLYNWLVMPTVDSRPQQEEWIDTYMSADGVLSYSDFGKNVLMEQSNDRIKFMGTASPAVDLEDFKVLNQEQTRSMLGIPSDSIIIGSVMRNQKRKLIPDLFSSFRQLLNELEENTPEIADKIYLYLHTSYPDIGWNIPSLLKEHGISNRVLFTYFCKNCGSVHCSTFNHPIKNCPVCSTKAAKFPSAAEGITTTQLAHIYNAFDIYVQYAICEGFGMPQVEAAACGLPIVTVDYSAMTDIADKLESYRIPVLRFFKEMETEADRAYPDNKILVKKLKELVLKPAVVRKKIGFNSRELVEKYYNWDKVSEIWQDAFDKIMSNPQRKVWDISKIKPMKPINVDELQRLDNNYDMISNIFDYNIGQHNEFYEISKLNMLKNIDYGFVNTNTEIINYNINNYLNYLESYIQANNIAYNALRNENAIKKDEFILYSHKRLQLQKLSNK